MPTFICPKMGKNVNLETGQTFQINSVAVVNQDVTTTGTPTFAKVNIDSTKGTIDSDANGQIIIDYNNGADGTYSLKVYDGSTNLLFAVDRTGGLTIGNSGDSCTVTVISQGGVSEGGSILSYRAGANAWRIGDKGIVAGGVDSSDLTLYGFSTNDICFYPRTALTATVNNTGINLATGKVIQINGSTVVSQDVTATASPTFVSPTVTTLKVGANQVVGARVVDARATAVANSGDATTDGLIDALRDAMISHGLIAAS